MYGFGMGVMSVLCCKRKVISEFVLVSVLFLYAIFCVMCSSCSLHVLCNDVGDCCICSVWVSGYFCILNGSLVSSVNFIQLTLS